MMLLKRVCIYPDDSVEEMRKEAFPFEEEEIDRTDYYLTNPNNVGVVKIGQRIILKDGTMYGKIIPIHLAELRRLIMELP